jgi:uncharacterized protein YbbK (DUF523 family)
MLSKPLVGISTCLIGGNVRYDGRNKQNTLLWDVMSGSVDFIQICPEVDSGMTVPREPVELHEKNGVMRVFTAETGEDITPSLTLWMEQRLVALSTLNLSGFIFKSKSPSCALNSARIHRGAGKYSTGAGIFAHALSHTFPGVPLKEDTCLQSRGEIEAFLEKVFAAARHSSKRGFCAES